MAWLIYDTTNKSFNFSSGRCSAPDHIIQVECTEEDEKKLISREYIFDPNTKTIVKKGESQLLALEIENKNYENLRFLSSTDWMVLRHLREKALGEQTSLTEEQFLQLEANRHVAAKSIQDIIIE